MNVVGFVVKNLLTKTTAGRHGIPRKFHQTFKGETRAKPEKDITKEKEKKKKTHTSLYE